MSEASNAVVISIPWGLAWSLQLDVLNGKAKLRKFALNIVIYTWYSHGYAGNKQIDFTYNLFAFFSLCLENYAYAYGMQYMVLEHNRIAYAY